MDVFLPMVGQFDFLMSELILYYEEPSAWKSQFEEKEIYRLICHETVHLSERKLTRMAEPIDELTKELTTLTVTPSFSEHACDSMTQKFGESWRDASTKVSYKWGNVGNQPKEGDEAEREVIRHLSSQRFCELLGEPVYIISGKYCNMICPFFIPSFYLCSEYHNLGNY